MYTRDQRRLRRDGRAAASPLYGVARSIRGPKKRRAFASRSPQCSSCSPLFFSVVQGEFLSLVNWFTFLHSFRTVRRFKNVTALYRGHFAWFERYVEEGEWGVGVGRGRRGVCGRGREGREGKGGRGEGGRVKAIFISVTT